MGASEGLEPPGNKRVQSMRQGWFAMLASTMPHVALPEAQTLAAYVIFLASYVVFALGKFPGLKIDRTGAAIIGAVGMVAFRIVQPDQALEFVNFSTIVL